DFIVQDERARALLDALRDTWSSPAVARLFQRIPFIIANRAAIQSTATKRYFENVEAHSVLLDRAKSIFIERLPGAVLDALRQALYNLANASADAAVAELPKPKRKRRARDPKTAARSMFDMYSQSIALIRALQATNKDWLSQTFVAALHYWKCDHTAPGAITEARRKYDKMSQMWRYNRLRAYKNLLKRKTGSAFDEIVADTLSDADAPVE